MDPALSVLDRALKGDAGALSFLDRTASIYVYDCTNCNAGALGNNLPKICGAWDFLNQALTEVDRCEARMMNAQSHGISLEAHLQLLATMSRRAAQRCPVADQKLVEVCLSNAAHFHEHGSNEIAHHLIQLNQQVRDRVMGRIATITFDFTNHRWNTNAIPGQVAFSNPVTMDSLCAIVAANAISTGPREFSNLVLEWIVPSLRNMPPFSVAAVIYHLASESIGKSAPVGTMDTLNSLLDPVLSKILAPMLQEAVRESDHCDNGMDTNTSADKVNGRTTNQRIAAIILKALERWCAATTCNIVQVKNICRKVNIDITAVISDAMYSDSGIVMDALSELLETLIRQQAQNETTLKGLSIMKGVAGTSSFGSPLLQIEKDLTSEAQARDEILSELVSAISLQRFRFSSHLSDEDSGVCRCLANIARSVVEASRSLLKSGKLQGQENGMITILLKATSHSSLNVYSIALDAINSCMSSKPDLPTRLLPILQGKAIAPPSLVGLSNNLDVDIDFHGFERFRENQLSDILCNCYINCRSYYMESCCIAIEEFCSGAPNPHTPYQLEAALFCLCAVSFDASKRALLVKASPAAQAAAAKACASQLPGSSVTSTTGIGEDAKHHDEKLSRCILAVSKRNSISSFDNPLLLSQLCRLLGKYANWISKTPSENVLDAASGLTLSCFNEAISHLKQHKDISFEIAVSPFTQSVLALRNILRWAPTRFANADALSALENGWRSIYSSPCCDNVDAIIIEDRKSLCAGITRVLAVLSPEQWSSSLSTLANPTIECIENILKTINNSEQFQDKDKLEGQMSRMSEEICVFATILRNFHSAAKKQEQSLDKVNDPMFALLRRIWPYITHIATSFSRYEMVMSSLSEFLLIVISLQDKNGDVSLIKEASDTAVAIIDVATKQESKSCSISPMMDFTEEMIEIFGPQAESFAKSLKSPSSRPHESAQQKHTIVERLIRTCFLAVRKTNGQANIDDALPGLFSVCRACIRNCPVLFMEVRVSAESQQTETMFSASLNASIPFVSSRQIEVIRASMLYINECFGLVNNAQNETSAICEKIVSSLRGDLLSILIKSSCGAFPREVLDPAGKLLYSILKSTEAMHAEEACTRALQEDVFRLGANAKRATLLTLGKAAQATIPASVIMDLLDDLWTMHQNDFTGGSAGGDAILSFTKKYNR